jgi:hypothetical protein
MTTIPTLISLKFVPKVIQAPYVRNKNLSVANQLFSEYFIIHLHGKQVNARSGQLNNKLLAYHRSFEHHFAQSIEDPDR